MPDRDPSGLALWGKLMVVCSEQDRYDGRPLYVQLVRRLRESGASGVTAVRGVWGYHGDHAPHGDRALSLRRRVPVVCELVDAPAAIGQSFEIVDLLTREAGLVTSEMVPALRPLGGGANRELGVARHRWS